MIRQASHQDFDFIYEAIVQSEYSGGDIFPYESLFGMKPAEFKETVFNIFEEEIDGMPWHYEHWYINELNGHAAGLYAVGSKVQTDYPLIYYTHKR